MAEVSNKKQRKKGLPNVEFAEADKKFVTERPTQQIERAKAELIRGGAGERQAEREVLQRREQADPAFQARQQIASQEAQARQEALRNQQLLNSITPQVSTTQTTAPEQVSPITEEVMFFGGAMPITAEDVALVTSGIGRVPLIAGEAVVAKGAIKAGLTTTLQATKSIISRQSIQTAVTASRASANLLSKSSLTTFLTIGGTGGFLKLKLSEAGKIATDATTAMGFVNQRFKDGDIRYDEALIYYSSLEGDVNSAERSVKWITHNNILIFLTGGKDTMIQLRNIREQQIPALRNELEIERQKQAILNQQLTQ